MCVCISLCTTAVHNTAQNSSDNLPSYPQGNHHSSDIYWRGGGSSRHTAFRHLQRINVRRALGLDSLPNWILYDLV